MTARRQAITVAALVLLALPATAQAQWWSQHPGYLRAMSDLRAAYWMIQHRAPSDPGQSAAEGRAQAAIRSAYGDLQQASIDDGKSIDDQPPAQMQWGDPRGRLHEAEALLHRAHDDVAHEEDNPAARGLRNRAIQHIDDAGRLTAAAIADRHF